jgi:hypothetical protein
VRTGTLEQGLSVALCLRVRFLADVEDPVVGFTVDDADGRRIFAATTEWSDPLGAFAAGEVVDVAVSFDNWFAPGRYAARGQVQDRTGGLLAIQAEPARFLVSGARTGGGVVDVPHAFTVLRGQAVSGRGA